MIKVSCGIMHEDNDNTVNNTNTMVRCIACGGTGVDQITLNQSYIAVDCFYCNGTGYVDETSELYEASLNAEEMAKGEYSQMRIEENLEKIDSYLKNRNIYGIKQYFSLKYPRVVRDAARGALLRIKKSNFYSLSDRIYFLYAQWWLSCKEHAFISTIALSWLWIGIPYLILSAFKVKKFKSLNSTQKSEK